MSVTTWNEFKAEVEKQMARKDISGDDEIHYIDWNPYDEVFCYKSEIGIII